MNSEINELINSINNLKKSNDEFISLNNSLLSSDLDLEHKLASSIQILNAVIKNQSFILDIIKTHADLIGEHRNSILNIIDKTK
jgi:hypothetical protein